MVKILVVLSHDQYIIKGECFRFRHQFHQSVTAQPQTIHSGKGECYRFRHQFHQSVTAQPQTIHSGSVSDTVHHVSTLAYFLYIKNSILFLHLLFVLGFFVLPM